jgi:hypothetical protein
MTGRHGHELARDAEGNILTPAVCATCGRLLRLSGTRWVLADSKPKADALVPRSVWSR